MTRLLPVFLVVVLGACSADRGLTLAKKAAVFEYDMRERFLLDGQALCKLKLPTDAVPFVSYNMPDNAYMTGIYVGSLALKYATTQDPTVREQARQSLGALDLLCTVSGKRGLLARAAWPLDKAFDDDGIWRESPNGTHQWRGDVSSDQVTGVMFGYALAYDFVADPDDKTVLARNVGDIVGAILDDDLRIIGYDGQPTAWGKYFPTYVRDFEHMNALLLLQHVKVAHHVTEDERFAREYRRLAYDMGYADIAVTARAMGDPTRRGAVNHSDDVLLFLAYYPLLRYETDPDLRAKYLASLRRTWEGDGSLPGVKPEANPLYAFLANAFLNDDSGTAAGIQTLRWFPFDMKWNRDTIAQYQTQFGFAFDPRPVSPALGPGQPIPLDRRQKTWSAWVADPYAEAGDRTADSLVVYNGHDYLIAYWLGRYHSLIGPEL